MSMSIEHSSIDNLLYSICVYIFFFKSIRNTCKCFPSCSSLVGSSETSSIFSFHISKETWILQYHSSCNTQCEAAAPYISGDSLCLHPKRREMRWCENWIFIILLRVLFITRASFVYTNSNNEASFFQSISCLWTEFGCWECKWNQYGVNL